MKNPVLERLHEYAIHPRKDLGQHFLIDGNVLDRIVHWVDASPDDLVLEFGAGLGVLTERLLDSGARVVAVELDDEMIRVLRDALATRDRLTVLHADLAQVNVDALRSAHGVARVKLAGNLPYQLTSRVLFTTLELADTLASAVFMVQREVAERIVAAPGSRQYGILSVLLNAYYDVRIGMRVKRGAFTPAPRVESAVLCITPRLHGPALAWDERSALIRLVKSVFNERRKVLRNTLRKFYELEDEAVAECERSSALDFGRRPETLGVDEFVRLLHALPCRSSPEASCKLG